MSGSSSAPFSWYRDQSISEQLSPAHLIRVANLRCYGRKEGIYGLDRCLCMKKSLGLEETLFYFFQGRLWISFFAAFHLLAQRNSVMVGNAQLFIQGRSFVKGSVPGDYIPSYFFWNMQSSLALLFSRIFIIGWTWMTRSNCGLSLGNEVIPFSWISRWHVKKTYFSFEGSSDLSDRPFLSEAGNLTFSSDSYKSRLLSSRQNFLPYYTYFLSFMVNKVVRRISL